MKIVRQNVLACLVICLVSIGSASASAEAQSVRNKQRFLPPCVVDSFVTNAGVHAENIYGDEGVYAQPPLAYFTKASRINAGIMDQRDLGLTTGHGSYLPNASGRDEYLAGGNSEWDLSGTRGHTSSDQMDGNAILQRDIEQRGKYSYNQDGTVAYSQDRSGRLWLPVYDQESNITSWIPASRRSSSTGN